MNVLIYTFWNSIAFLFPLLTWVCVAMSVRVCMYVRMCIYVRVFTCVYVCMCLFQASADETNTHSIPAKTLALSTTCWTTASSRARSAAVLRVSTMSYKFGDVLAISHKKYID